MTSGREIFAEAAVILNDEEYVRWPLPELCTWLNEGVKAIILAKPSAYSHSRIIPLQTGTLQNVPVAGNPTPLLMVRAVRNLLSTASPREGGRIITPTNHETLDAQLPFWHDRRHVQWRKEVRHVIYDEDNPLEFYVYPGNDGTGLIEAILSELPPPLVASGSPDVLASYQGDIGLPEPYSVPLLDYVLFRSFSKDDLEGSAGRALAHYQAFAAAIGLKIQVEGATSPNRRKS